MNILIVSGHPAQVHNFKFIKSELEARNHNVFWLASDKDISIYLLDHYKIRYEIIIRPGNSYFSKTLTLIKNTIFIIKFARRNDIDLAISRISPYVSLAFWLLRKPHIGLTDTETAVSYDRFFGQMVSAILTAKSYKLNLRKDQIRYDANIELFYLHPKRYSPGKGTHALLGLTEDIPYIIMRFVSWDAYHDKGLSGFTIENKHKAVLAFSEYGRVFITSEKPLPKSLESYHITISPEKIHDVLAKASLFFGESATMASESAILGTPAIYLDEFGRGYTDEEGMYNLVFNFRNDENSQLKAIAKGIELLNDPFTKQKTQENRNKFLEGKTDPTSFLLWHIENYSNSIKSYKKQ